MHEKHRLPNQKWCMIITIKNSIHIISRLPNKFCAKAMETTNYLHNKPPIRYQTHSQII